MLTVHSYDEAGNSLALERTGIWLAASTDLVGTPHLLLDSTGQVVKAIERAAFGAVRSDSTPGPFLPAGFAGRHDDPATGLVRFGIRDYDAAAGQWASRDPVRFRSGQANLDAYIGSQRVSLRELAGLACAGASVHDAGGGWATSCLTVTGTGPTAPSWGVGFGASITAGVGDLDAFRAGASEGGLKSGLPDSKSVPLAGSVGGRGVQGKTASRFCAKHPG